MIAGDYEFLVTIKDQASGQMKEIMLSTSKDAGQLATALKGLSAATGQQGKEVSALTGFYREQRSEQRMMNFYAREGKQAIGALAFGMMAFEGAIGKSNTEMKQLSNSISTGIMNFMGLEFALSALKVPGLWSVVIAGIGGITSALISMNSASDEAVKKNQALKDQLFESKAALGGVGDETKLEYYAKRRIEVEKQLADLKAKGSWDVEEELRLNIEINNLEKKRLDTWKEMVTGINAQNKEDEQSEEKRLELAWKHYKIIEKTAEIQKSPINLLGGVGVEGVKPSPMVKLTEAQLDMNREFREAMERSFEDFGLTAQSTAYMVRDAMSGAADAITDAFFGASKSIEQFFLAMIKRVAAAMIEEWVLKGLMKGVMSLFGGGTFSQLMPDLPGGPTSPIPTAGRQRLVNSIDEAYYVGKG